MKRFGTKAHQRKPADPIPFEFTVLRDGEPEVHQFTARPQVDAASLTYTMATAKTAPDKSMVGLMRVIGKMLDNRDGTPANWEPKEYRPPRPVNEYDEAIEDADVVEAYQRAVTEAEQGPKRFVGPDGEPHPMSDLERFIAPEAGSSRRRWRQLMEEDDDAVVEAEDLAELFEWLVSEAAKRPTRPSS